MPSLEGGAKDNRKSLTKLELETDNAVLEL
jgi:hypothetical protein